MQDLAFKKEDVFLTIEEKLKEEKWTRATIDNYSVKNFIELDSYIRIAIDENYKEELKNLCRENIKNYQNSIVGLYIIGILSLEESSVDDAHIPQIIKIFLDNKKYSVAEFLSKKLLSYRENKFALKTLETIYEIQNATKEELFNIKKRLVLVDNKDANNARILGDYYEKEGDKDLAIFYYKLAIERLIKNKSNKMVEELWSKVVNYYLDDPQQIIFLATKLKDIFSDVKIAEMIYNDYVKLAMKNGKFKSALKALKYAINLNPEDKSMRKSIEDCYREIYKNHTQLEKYLKLSNISQSWKSPKEAIRMFESHIMFDIGCYVYHNSWGIGQVMDINNDKIVIDFTNKKGHEMHLDIALRALQVLGEDNIYVWKQYKKNELMDLIQNDRAKVIELILRSHDNSATNTIIKKDLVPDILKESEWTKWWNQAKKDIENNPNIVQSLSNKNCYEIRESSLSVADEIISKFKKATSFENKVKYFIDYVLRGYELSGGVDKNQSNPFIDYFNEILNASTETSERKLISFILFKFANYEKFHMSAIDPSIIFSIKDLNLFFQNLDNELKTHFLEILTVKLKDWPVKFYDFVVNTEFNTKINHIIIETLINAQKYDEVNRIILYAINNYQDNPELFVWIAKILFEENDLFIDENNKSIKDNFIINKNEIVLRLLSLLDNLEAQLNTKTNVARNKKVIGQINDLLFKRKIFDKYIEEAEEFESKSLIILLKTTTSVPDKLKEEYISRIEAKYPSLKEIDTVEKVKMRHTFLVSKAAYEKKKAELTHIISVEIPENSKAIGEAMEKGDLRENAEYKAALEKQDQLKALASKLENELNEAKIIDPDKVRTDYVDVGTVVTVEGPNGIETYTILGQWDVDLEKNIISYHSPLGKIFLDKKVGAKAEFNFNGEEREYKILKIEKAKI